MLKQLGIELKNVVIKFKMRTLGLIYQMEKLCTKNTKLKKVYRN